MIKLIRILGLIAIAGILVLPLAGQQDTLTITVNGSGTTNPAAGMHFYSPPGSNTAVQVSATPTLPGWEFTGWTGDVSGDSNPTTVIMNVNKAVEAVFNLIDYTMNLAVSPAEASGAIFSPSTSPIMTHGTPGLISVTVPTGYNFVNWTTSTPANVIISTPAATSTFMTVTGTPASADANFVLKEYSMSLTASPLGASGATFSPSSNPSMTHGVAEPIGVIAPPGYRFVNWTTTTPGTVSITDDQAASTTMEVTNIPASAVANFEQIWTMNMETVPAGLPGTNLSPGGSSIVVHNVATDISVDVPIGYRFIGWRASVGTASFANAASPITQVTVTAGPATIQARFERIHQVTMITDPPALPAIFTPAAVITVVNNNDTAISVTPPLGYRFDHWSVSAGTAIIGNPLLASTTVTAQSDGVELTAHLIRQHTLTMVSVPGGAAFTPLSPILVDQDSTQAVSVGALAGHVFSGWSVTSGIATIEDTAVMSANVILPSVDATITARFIPQYTLNLISNQAGATFIPTSPVTVTKNVARAISVTPPTNYRFENWEVTSGLADITDPLSASTTVTMNNGNATIRANFVRVYSLSLLSSPAGADFTPDSPLILAANEPVIISVANIAGYEFSQWSLTSGSAVIGNQNLQTTTVVLPGGDAVLTAEFAPVLTLNLEANIDGVNFAPSPPISIAQNEAVSIFASEPAGYGFDRWTVRLGTATILSPTTQSTSVILTDGDATLRANYLPMEYSLSMISDGTPGVVFNPESPVTVQHNVPVAISASVPAGYSFAGWTTEFGTTSIEDVTSSATNVTLTAGNAIIKANYIKVVGVAGVSIPNQSAGIGSVIPVTITVENDGGIPYTLLSGTVGGYSLQSFSRINATSYSATILITQGGNSYLAAQDIPVSNLVITNGDVTSPPFNSNISQNGDPIDAQLPLISSMAVVAGTYKVGDVVRVNLVADGPGYRATDATTINGLRLSAPNVSFQDRGGGNYRLNYTVVEGNMDVAPGNLLVSVTLEKPSGNTSQPFTNLTGAALVTIDAHAPVTTRMEVPNLEIGVGQDVQVTITANGEGYTAASGTVINGIPLSSSMVSFQEISGGLYSLTYKVSTGDPQVSAGSLKVSLVLSDAAGNNSLPFANLESNTLEVYTQLPTAQMVAGSPQICEGEETELTIYLEGREPFEFDLFDGSTTIRFSDISSSVYHHAVSPLQSTTYTIPVVRDRNGVVNAGTGNASIIVDRGTNVTITGLATGYNVETDPFRLTANVSGGVFSGPGVNSTSGFFDPEKAGTENSPHKLFYTYTNNNGCMSMDSSIVFVLAADGDIYIPDSVVCEYSDPFEVRASNVSGSVGTFKLYNEDEVMIPGLSDHLDNTATVDPSGLLGDYIIEYEYRDGITFYIREHFVVESVEEPEIQIPGDKSVFCQNDDPVSLSSNVPSVIFYGDGVVGSQEEGFSFDPSMALLGQNVIHVLVTSASGCSKESSDTLLVYFAPDAKFTIRSSCLDVGGGLISFNNQTDGKLEVETWKWNFGDVNSGASNFSNEIDPEHFYPTAGNWTITLEALTYSGCSSSFQLDTSFSNQPHVDFTWLSDCHSENEGIKLVSQTSGSQTEIESMKWIFKDEGGDVIDEIDASLVNDTSEYKFPGAGEYQVSLYARNLGGCADTAVHSVSLRPTIMLDADGYAESFNDSQALWSIESEDNNASWVWDTPNFTGYTPVDGDKSWFTSLPSGAGEYMEHSWIQSPCFDFNGMRRPLIQLDIMRSFVPNINGGVFQYMDNRAEGWKTIGKSATGLNWYNAFNIHNRPGGSPVGWGLDIFSPDRDWLRATHGLDDLKDKKAVSLRLAIATNGAQAIGNQGFAFDNILITEKTKLAVLEHFTNSSDASSMTADAVVDDYASSNMLEVVDLQYHTDYPGEDPMNENNQYAAEAAFTRAVHLGVGQVPFAVLDGEIVDTDYRYDFSDAGSYPDAAELGLLSLEIPDFSVDLDVDWQESDLVASTTVTCEADSYAEDVQLHLVVFETLVTAYTGGNGDESFRNVVLRMLPSAAGKLLKNNWEKGDSETQVNSWTFENVEDVQDLAVVAFVHDRLTRQVLQAAVNYKTPLTGLKDRKGELRELSVYPNPAHDLLHVNLGQRNERKGMVMVTDLNGRRVLNMEVPPGYQIVRLEVDELTPGMYLLHYVEGGQLISRSKFIKNR